MQGRIQAMEPVLWLSLQRGEQAVNLTELAQDAIRLDVQIDVIEELISDYERGVEHLLDARTSCEARIVSERLIPVTVMSDILRTGENGLDVPIRGYYAYVDVTKIIEYDEQLICVLRAPLFENASPMQLTIHTFPICDSGKCVQIHQPEPFVINYDTEEIYFPNTCRGPKPQACLPGVRYDKNQQLCLHGLSTDDRVQQQQCPVTLFDHVPPPGRIVTGSLNRFVLRTEKARYHYRCPSERPTVGSLSEGTYIINIEPNCVFDTPFWMLQGVPVQNFNYSESIAAPRPLNLSWFKLPAIRDGIPFSIVFPNGINQIDVPKYDDLETLTLDDNTLQDNVDQYLSKVGVHHFSWYWWLILFVFLLVTLTIAAYKCQKRFKLCSKSVNTPRVRYDNKTEQVDLEIDGNAEDV